MYKSINKKTSHKRKKKIVKAKYPITGYYIVKQLNIKPNIKWNIKVFKKNVYQPLENASCVK